MVQVIRMPMMGNTMETGTLVEWALAEGSEVEEGAREIAVHHDWPVPALTVTLDGERPTVTVEDRDDLSRATARRLAYAACRESRYADAIPGLRDPTVEVR